MAEKKPAFGFGPPGGVDLGGNLGAASARFKEAHVQELVDGADRIRVKNIASTTVASQGSDGLMAAADKARLDGMSGYTPQVTVYVSGDGSDANNGLSAGTPFKTVDGMFASLTQSYPGVIGRLTINLRGTAPISGGFAFPDSTARMVVRSCVINGEGMASTLVNCVGAGITINKFTEYVEMSGLTLRIGGTKDAINLNSPGLSKGAVIKNVKISRSDAGRGIWVGPNSWLRLQEQLTFEGPYSYTMNAYCGGFIQIQDVTSLVFQNGSCSQIMSILYRGEVVVATPLVPTYDNFTRVRFASLSYGARVILPKGSTLEGWSGGSAILKDNTSSIEIVE